MEPALAMLEGSPQFPMGNGGVPGLPGTGAGQAGLFRLVWEKSADGMRLCDPAGIVLLVNEAYCRLVGKPRRELEGHSFAVIYRPEFRVRLERSIRRRFEERSIPEFLEREMTLWNSRKLRLEVSNSILELEGGAPLVLSIFRDVTARYKAQAELQRARMAAEAAGCARNEFVAAMSHEILTPLNGILGLADLILDTSLTSEQSDCVSGIRSSARLLFEVLSNVLEFARLESNQVAVVRHPFLLRQWLAFRLGPLETQAALKGLRLCWGCDPRLPDRVVGDTYRLGRALDHIVGNAIKFTRRGSVLVEVDAADEAAPGSLAVRFTVCDTGIGVAPDHHQAIFEPFRQVDMSSARVYGGAGLGLTVAARLVEKLGGTMSVDSRPDFGSAFAFTVPLAVAEEGGEDNMNFLDSTQPECAAAPPLDRAVALEQVGGDVDLLREIAGLFLDEAGTLLEEIRRAIGAGDPTALEHAAHTLKGSVGNFGAEPARRAAYWLELLGRNRQLESAGEALANLERELDLLRPALQTLVNE